MTFAGSPLPTDADLDAALEHAFRVLEHVGVAAPSSRALAALRAGGAAVDHERYVARVPRALVEDCLELTPGTVLLAARDPAHDILLGSERPLVCCADGEGTLVVDDDSGLVRDATLADMCSVMRLYDALPEIDFLWTSLAAPSLEPETAALAVDAVALRESAKHLQSVSPKTVAQVPALVTLLEAAAGASLAERPIYSILHCTVAPLQHDRAMTDANLDLAACGATICLTSMPQMGTTAPMSVAGLCAIVMAELLSGVVLFQLACPGARLVVEPMPGVTDMRTGGYLGGSAEVALANLACVALCRRLGLPTIGSGSTTDANAVDFQAGAEDMLLWLSVALAGAHGLVASSFLNGSRALSPAKVVLDADAIGVLQRLLRGAAFDDAAALLDDVAAVGPGGHFLGRASTRRRTRAGEVFEPHVLRRRRLEDRVDGALVGDAAERARELLARHEVRPLPDEAERLVHELLPRAQGAG